MKALTRDQLEGRKKKAVRFVRDVLDDADRADEITEESLEDYAARRKIEILDNPRRRLRMPRKRSIQECKAELADLKAQVAELEAENYDLQDRLDQVMDIVAPEEEDGDEEPDDDPGE